MKRKRLAAVLLTGMLSMGLLAGCGTESTDKGGDEGESSGKKTITMMFQGVTAENDFETTVLPGLIEEQFPDVTVEITKLPDEQYYTALKTKLASGECPDIIKVQPRHAGANAVVSLAEAGYLEPLTDLEFIQEEPDSAKEDMTYDGEVYAASTGLSILGTWYNKDMFEENNLEIPTNWDEFLNCCKVLKDAGIQPIVMGDKDMFVTQFGLYQIAANQLYPENPDYDEQLASGDASFTDEGTWDTILDMYNTLYEEGYVDESSLGLGQQQAQQKFIDGEAAMTFDGSFSHAAVCADGSAEFERGFFPLPANDEGEDTYACIAGASGIAVYSGSENKDICKEILQSWFGGESDIYSGWADNDKPIISWGPASENIDPLFQLFADMYNEGKSYYFCNQGWPSGTENEMEAKFSELIGGQGTTVKDITESMQLKYEDLSGN
ncbi:MAG TPA: extracellular solute-binding protein [Candidatus Blautia faecipullorum]|nr:extracellular solute-binding protein [Candidatus Blautia faecipullorum]